MKAFILAAGLGERLRPYTSHVPKPLILVRGRPLIDHHLLALAEAGYASVVINVFHLADQVRDHVGNGSRFGIPVVYSDETQTGLLGVYGGVHHALGLLGDAPFVLLSADIWTDFPLCALRDLNPASAHCVMVPNPPWHAQGDFWVDEAQGRLVQQVFPADDASVLTASRGSATYGNIGVYQPAFFEPPPVAQHSFGQSLAAAVRTNHVTAEIYHGAWHNVGTVGQWRDAACEADALPDIA